MATASIADAIGALYNHGILWGSHWFISHENKVAKSNEHSDNTGLNH